MNELETRLEQQKGSIALRIMHEARSISVNTTHPTELELFLQEMDHLARVAPQLTVSDGRVFAALVVAPSAS